MGLDPRSAASLKSQAVRCRNRSWLRRASVAAPTAKPQLPKIKKLRAMFPGLRSLDLCKVSACFQHQRADVVSVVPMVMIVCSAVATTCTSYERPSVLQARGVMPEHLPMIATMPRLAHLSLKRCRGVTNACLADLAPLTGLSSLSLARCYQVTAAAGHSAGVQVRNIADF